MDSNVISLPDTEELEPLDSVAREFRRGFEELALSAETELSGRNFVFSRYGRELYPYFEETGATVVPGCILPIKEGRPVASVDSTCILMGETSDGALYAARTAVGISQGGSLRRYFRMGPILVYASASGLTGIRSELSSPETSLLLSDHTVAERLIRNIIERRVTESLLGSDREMTVVADGSLKHPFGQFLGGMPEARPAGNYLIGFSKSSNLIFSEGAVSSLSNARGAVYHLLDGGLVKTVLAKFTADGLVFRLDLAGLNEPVEKALGRLLWNDAFAAGYPESLKAAHHLSVFSKAEGQALKAFVTKRFRLRQLPTFNLRTITLGSFKGGA
ncbi:MAG: hypothetical protein LYZ66_01900 [Nitrososphaerales archaeon]|nr:hypothetical protein [Nitrososphaerales archaeon]